MSKSKSNLKDKAKGLQIQPSATAWPKLEAKLHSKKTHKSFQLSYWLIAASMVGILVISLVFIFTHADRKQTEKDSLKIKTEQIIKKDTLKNFFLNDTIKNK